MRTSWSKANIKIGFTLVELLVVLVIVVILMGLLLPAIDAAREAARRCACSSNLSQLAIAVFNFESQHEHLPTGVINNKGPIRSEPIGQHVSWIVQVLPQIDEHNVADQFDVAAGAYATVNAKLRSTRLAVLRCPSLDGTAGNIPQVSDGSFINSYAGCHHDLESPIDNDNHGVLFLQSRLRWSDIDDGCANTIMLGEFSPETNSLGWASGTRATLRNTGSLPNGLVITPKGPRGPPKPAVLIVGGFGSLHTGGAQFAFADGSIRFLSQTIDANAYQAAGHRADGNLSHGSEYW